MTNKIGFQEAIVVKGASQHNLKSVNLALPKNSLIVVTGVSGSGKSSLAFDTLYAEGHRRYVASLSNYARQFIDRLEKPEYDAIYGLTPSIAIEQRTILKNPRSTVGTITEIYNFLRVLYARCGTAHCPKCSRQVSSQSIDGIAGQIAKLPAGTRFHILSPVVRARKGIYKKELSKIYEMGFVRARIDGEMTELAGDISLRRAKLHNIDVVVDSLVVKKGMENRLKDSLALALRLATSLTTPCLGADAVIVHNLDAKEDLVFSRGHACPDCGINLPEMSPRLFSFNSPFGWCLACEGFGYIENEKGKIVCDACAGARLRPESKSVRIGGKSINEFASVCISDNLKWIEKFDFSGSRAEVAKPLIREISERLNFLKDVGLGYLTLDRPSFTLSGGEAQRVRLATQVGCRLRGVLYVLDEPTIGLHLRDNLKLLETLKFLRDLGNTVVVVEHDETTIRSADYIVDLGPKGGAEGGYLIAQGAPTDIANSNSLTGDYLSGREKIPVPTRKKPSRQGGKAKWIEIVGAAANNLKNITVKIPIGLLTVVSGVSGSGKSTLVVDILYKSALKTLYDSNAKSLAHKAIKGLKNFRRVVAVGQSPIGSTSRSNPATYSGLYEPIRALFSALPEARIRGYKKGRFSFNVKGGRCEGCKGAGVRKVEMAFIADQFVPCETCGQRRFNRETLAVRYRGKNISDVLDMSAEEASDFFKNIPQINKILETLCDVGLGYLSLGQPSHTLSGGEAQRLHLARELARADKGRSGKTLYILDEPTIGLHFHDVKKLLAILFRLRDNGNTVVIIEHHPDVLKCADYIIDLGPEGGAEGGFVIAEGAPEEIARCETSFTGKILKNILNSAEGRRV